MNKSYLPLYLLACITSIDGMCPVAPLFTTRSQGVNAPRELAGLTNHINIFDMEKFYGTFALTPEYTRSFDNNDITACLFGSSINNCECPSIKISGSSVQDRAKTDWLADYFGLPTDFESSLTFNPRVTNYLIDFYLYLGLDEWLCGLFAFVHAPVVNSRWDLNFAECNITPGSSGYPIGYFAPTAVGRSTLYNSFTEYVSDCTGLDFGNNVLMEPLKYARMSSESKSATALADIRFALGWNFFQDEDYHLGLGLLAAAPTGTRPEGNVLFEPIVGNGHHWECGALIWGHAVFWRSECEEKFFSGWMQANITHLFKAHQYRFFDLNCQPNSRYMLAEKMGNPVDLLLANATEGAILNSTVPNNQFQNLFAPVANITRQEVDVSAAIQADILVLLNYTSCGFSWDLGYNFWAKTCDKITPNSSCPPRIQTESWALKGDAYVFGFTSDIVGSSPAGTPVALSATESKATLNAGTNNNVNTNPMVDNVQWAVAGASQTASVLLYNSTTGTTQTETSNNPILLTTSNIDYAHARTKGLSQKVFTHFNYSWLDNEDWTPYVGFGAEIEFAQKGKHCEDISCNTTVCGSSSCSSGSCSPSSSTCYTCLEDECHQCSLSQWGVWLKAGISFN